MIALLKLDRMMSETGMTWGDACTVLITMVDRFGSILDEEWETIPSSVQAVIVIALGNEAGWVEEISIDKEARLPGLCAWPY